MHLEISREQLFPALQRVVGAIERKQTNPVLGNILIEATNDIVTLTGTDSELEIVTSVPATIIDMGKMVIPGRKLFDICRSLSNDATLSIEKDHQQAKLHAGKSRFVLVTAKPEDFPVNQSISFISNIRLPEGSLKTILEQTSFAMAHQDVRYYLNGTLLELEQGFIRSIATDGHRLAYAQCGIDTDVGDKQQIILPRKTILELQRLLENETALSQVEFGERHFRITTSSFRLTSKIVDGRFPDYTRVIPQDGDKEIMLSREILQKTLNRVAILSAERYRGAKLILQPDNLTLVASNQEQEMAEEEIAIDYQGEYLEIGFNVNYLIDVLSVINNQEVKISLKDADSSCLITDPNSTDMLYVLMPMRL